MKYTSFDQLVFDEEEIPIFVPVFNLVSYTKHMVAQLKEYGFSNFIICDNDSTYEPMVDYLENLSKTDKVLFLGKNYGPRYFIENLQITSKMPKHFIITDPDLIFNPNMPKKTAISKMIRIAEMYDAAKCGLALEIFDAQEKELFFNKEQVFAWENNYWKKKISYEEERDPFYAAPIDTTFVVYRRDKYINEFSKLKPPFDMSVNTSSIRVAGRFTCRHMGWWKDQPLTEEEYSYYRNTHKWSSTENEKVKMGYISS